MPRPRCLAVLVLTLVSFVATLSGCQQPLRPGLTGEASAAYAGGQHERALKLAAQVARRGEPPQREEAALIAGLAAQELRRNEDAERYLLQAAHSSDVSVAGDALASLGLMYARQEQYADSAQALTMAADRLTGQDRANAYFYAAVAQQKLGQWAQARTNLVLARSASADPAFREQVDEQLSVIGYTLQLGAFENVENAQQFAEELASRTLDANLGVPAVRQSEDRNGQPLSVVQLGRYSTFDSAAQARNRLGINEAVIVPLAAQ